MAIFIASILFLGIFLYGFSSPANHEKSDTESIFVKVKKNKHPKLRK